jgi:transcriptional regulator with XRE-family HTH domain
MYSVNKRVQSMYMWKGTSRALKAKHRPKRNFIREWRESRNLTLERLSERLREAQGLAITHASLSRIERGLQPYSEPVLWALAAELTQGDVASLLIRNPADPEGIWSIWDHASQGQRRMIVDIAKTITKTGT